MGTRGTLLLAALVAVLVICAYLDVRRDAADLSWNSFFGELQPTPLGEGAPKLVQFDPAAVTAIHLRRGNIDVRSQRRNGGWTGTARPATIEDFLQSVLDLAEIRKFDAGPKDLADLGLEPPQSEIELHFRQGAPLQIFLGDRNPPSTGVYARVEGRPGAYLTGALILWELEKATNALGSTPSPSVAG
jgi:Domain of unknown function (DUF4340)